MVITNPMQLAQMVDCVLLVALHSMYFTIVKKPDTLSAMQGRRPVKALRCMSMAAVP